MRAKYLTAAVIGSALMIAPALAQNTGSTSSGSDSQQAVNASSTGEWQASQLIRLNVYNDQNQKIGDIKELMMDKNGKIDRAVIGIGGFLGIGERDVAVKFSDLKFSDQPVPSSRGAGGNAPATSGAAGSPMAAKTQAKTRKNYPDHAILAMNKDQLQKLPQFNYNK